MSLRSIQGRVPKDLTFHSSESVREEEEAWDGDDQVSFLQAAAAIHMRYLNDTIFIPIIDYHRRELGKDLNADDMFQALGYPAPNDPSLRMSGLAAILLPPEGFCRHRLKSDGRLGEYCRKKTAAGEVFCTSCLKKTKKKTTVGLVSSSQKMGSYQPPPRKSSKSPASNRKEAYKLKDGSLCHRDTRIVFTQTADGEKFGRGVLNEDGELIPWLEMSDEDFENAQKLGIIVGEGDEEVEEPIPVDEPPRRKSRESWTTPNRNSYNSVDSDSPTIPRGMIPCTPRD